MDMRFAGKGTVPPGEYKKVSLSGGGRLFGEVRCTTFTASGSCKGEHVTCTQSFKTSGTATFSGSVKAKSIRAAGSLTAGDDLAAEDVLSVFGSLRVGGDARAKIIRIAGAARVSGTLCAEKIELQADKRMYAKSVHGSVVLMKRKRVSLFPRRGFSVSDNVEGDTLLLEYVTAPRVTGRAVTVGKGCKIALVQYREQITISPKAEVGKVEKV